MKYYVDKRIMEIVKEEDLDLNFMAPESYYEYCGNETDFMITEVWKVQKEDKTYGLLDVNYTIDTPNNMINMERDSMMEKNKVKGLFLVRFIVPKEWFNAAINKIYKE